MRGGCAIAALIFGGMMLAMMPFYAGISIDDPELPDGAFIGFVSIIAAVPLALGAFLAKAKWRHHLGATMITSGLFGFMMVVMMWTMSRDEKFLELVPEAGFLKISPGIPLVLAIAIGVAGWLLYKSGGRTGD